MMINGYGAIGGMRIGRGTEVLGGNPPHYNFYVQNGHMT
jgi:hypothetical protein